MLKDVTDHRVLYGIESVPDLDLDVVVAIVGHSGHVDLRGGEHFAGHDHAARPKLRIGDQVHQFVVDLA